MVLFHIFLFVILFTCFLLYLLCWIISYLKKLKHNGKFYNSVLKNKVVHILIPSNCSKEFTFDFIIKSREYDVAGFDCEWAPDKNISLIQISFPDGYTFLIRLFSTKTHIPVEVVNWLKDGTKLKFGVGVLEDSRKLEAQWGIELRGSVDLRNLAVRVKPNGLTKMGLKSLAACWLHINYPFHDDCHKLKSVQCSNWEQEELSLQQVEYACLDSIVGALCPVEFLCRKLCITPTEALKDIMRVKAFCQGCIDLKFKTSKIENNNNNQKRTFKNMTKSVRKTNPVYDNASLLTPDGEMLSKLSRKKAEWYLSRGLGIKVSDEPLMVKLSFEPSGRASGDDDYYIQSKENICVVCGCGSGCVRKNIVPIEYRRHYPVSHKSHKSHDVLLLCAECHRQCNVMDDVKKREIANIYNAPLGQKESINMIKSRVKNAAKALRFNDRIPESRLCELREIVSSYYGVENSDISPQLLQDTLTMSIGICDGENQCHGQIVVSNLKTAKELVDFEVTWRQHFLESMEPRHLPLGWSPNHRVDRYCRIDPK